MRKTVKKLRGIATLFYLFSLSFILLTSINVSASESATLTTDSPVETSSQIDIIDSDRPLTETEITNLINELEESKPKPLTRATGVAVSYYIIRSGNTTNCELRASYKATGPVSNLWWDKVTVQSPSILNRVTYQSFPKVLRGTGSKKSNNVNIGYLSIPKNIKSTYIKTSGTQTHSNKDGWGSLVNFNGSAKIN
ncbi:hypothetical protein IGI37_000517 [Enterococcus sp. AZ194]|uniref:hypothetical protein n=1 Tax=Enterococcus sp. AZ194 TaxID=2774629 RepID=UPI003F1F8E77